MKHNSDVPGQLTLLTVAPTIETKLTVHDPYWDEITAHQQVEGNLWASEIEERILVGGQVALDTKKIAHQHNTHWLEKYWVQRGSNKYWYYRYCYREGRNKNRVYLGSVSSITAKRKKADVEVWIADGKLPVEIKQLIQDWKHEPSTMPKVSRNPRFQER
jgi:hypothetical protein